MNAGIATICLVDDDLSFLKSIQRLLRAAGYTVEPFSSAEEYLESPASRAPGCLVLDLHMPGASGLEVQQALAARDQFPPIIFLTGRGDIPSSVRAMKSGAQDFLTKPVQKEDLLGAVESALAEDAAARSEQARQKELSDRYERLTPREQEVLGRVVAGLLNKQIASELGTTERTIKAHRAQVMAKMQVTSVAELTLAAQRLQLIG